MVELPLVDLLKYLMSICGETTSSGREGSTTALVWPAATGGSGAGAESRVAGAVTGSTILVFSGIGFGSVVDAAGGAGTCRLGCNTGRKRNGAGPTTGK